MLRHIALAALATFYLAACPADSVPNRDTALPDNIIPFADSSRDRAVQPPPRDAPLTYDSIPHDSVPHDWDALESPHDSVPVEKDSSNVCFNGAKDAGEADIDCGGICAAKCADGKTCTGASDCLIGSCYLGTCQPQPCENGSKDGDETDVDCGGSCPTPCAHGQGCAGDADCATGTCQGGACVVCTQTTPSVSGGGCNLTNSQRTIDMSLSGNTLNLRCRQSLPQEDVTYQSSITFAGGATLWGEGCAADEYLQYMYVDTNNNRLRLGCYEDVHDNLTTRYINVAGATLSLSTCEPGWQIQRIWQTVSNKIAIYCYDDHFENYHTGSINIDPATVCQ